MIGRVRGRMNSAYGSRRIRHYFCQSAGRGYYIMEDKPLRGRGKGWTLVGSYTLFIKDYGRFCARLFSWRYSERLRCEKWKQTRGAIRIYGGEIRSINYGQ